MSLLLPLLAFTVALPAAVAGALALALRRWWPLPAVAALAVGAGFVAGQLGVRGWRGWAPRESTDWLPVIALACTLIGATGAVRRGPPSLRALLRLAFAGVAVWLVIGRVLARQLQGPALLLELALPAAVLAAAWAALEALASQRARRGPSILLLLLACGGAVVLLISGSALLGQLAGALCAALGALLVAAWRRPQAGLVEGAAPVVMLTLGAQLARLTLDATAGRAAAQAALLLAAAPLAAWVLAVRAARRADRGRASPPGHGAPLEPGVAAPAAEGRLGAVQLAVAAACVAGAVLVALAASPPADGSGT